MIPLFPKSCIALLFPPTNASDVFPISQTLQERIFCTNLPHIQPLSLKPRLEVEDSNKRYCCHLNILSDSFVAFVCILSLVIVEVDKGNEESMLAFGNSDVASLVNAML